MRRSNITNQRIRLSIASLFCAVLLCLLPANATLGQTTGFTYQGALSDSGTVANGNYDLQFSLWDSLSGGSQIGSTQSLNTVAVTSGIFSVTLDFGANAFSGAVRFLEISTRPAGGGAFTLLTPRQQVTSTPYAIRSLSTISADTATNANQLGGVAANQYVQTNDARLSDPRPPTPGSSSYIQNGNSQQAANFNISGNGTAAGTLSASVVNVGTQYNIGGVRILSAPGTQNIFVGTNAGKVNTGNSNTFVGADSGSANTTGTLNAFFGTYAGQANTSGFANSFFGYIAGLSNTTGTSNSIFGREAGWANTTGNGNSFFGEFAGHDNVSGSGNSFFGVAAGKANTTGSNNNFFGIGAGSANTTGEGNSFFGNNAGQANKTTGNNSFFGTSAGFATTAGNNSFFGYKSGLANTTASGNSFFGSFAGIANTTGNNNSFFGVQSGLSNTIGVNNSFFGAGAGFSNAPGFGKEGNNNSYFGAFAGQSNSAGYDNSFFGSGAGLSGDGYGNSFFGSGAGQSMGGYNNSFFGRAAGQASTAGEYNVFVGAYAGMANTTGASNTFVGAYSGNDNTNSQLNAFLGFESGQHNTSGFGNTFIGNETATTNTTGNNNSTLGNAADVSSNNLTFATAIGAFATVSTSNTIALGRSNGSDGVRIPGTLTLTTLGVAGSTSVCRNALNQISTCSSSLRYKKDLQPFTRGLSLLNSLKPITFKWKADGSPDVGFGAEDVAAVEPLLVTHNANGEVEGVKYDRITAVLVNAVKEQQLQIAQQQRELNELRRLVNAKHRRFTRHTHQR